MGPYEGLSSEQMRALVAFAERNGRSWKSKLIALWMNGRDYYEPQGVALHQVRNNFGPTWLMDKFRIPTLDQDRR